MDGALRLATLFCVLAGPASALGYTCTYVTECFENDTCQDTAYELGVDVADDRSTATLSSVSGDVEATAHNAEGLSFYTGHANAAMHLVSVLAAGDSRYSFQTGTGDSLMAITYHGTCEQTQ